MRRRRFWSGWWEPEFRPPVHRVYMREKVPSTGWHIDTERQQAASLAEALRARYGADRARAIDDVPTAISGADGVVNATPVGMDKFPGLPVQPSLLRPRHWVADVVYFPLETELLREAKVRGCRTMSGACMAVFQAAEAFRLFSGEEPNKERMLLHFENM